MWILNYRITNENGNVKILQVGSRTGSIEQVCENTKILAGQKVKLSLCYM
jgi:hypothetical protein